MIASLQEAKSTSNELMSFMMDKKLRKCLCCDFSLAKSDHVLTAGMVKGLLKFANYSLSKRVRYINPRLDLHWAYQLTINEMTNWTKLRFFGLVAKQMIDGRHVGGKWVLTRNGWAFLRGELKIPVHVKTFRNRIVEKSEELVGIADIMDTPTNFPAHDDFYGDTVTGENLETARSYKSRRKGSKPKPSKCPTCMTGVLKKLSSSVIVDNLARVTYFMQCSSCGHKEEIG